jgi:protein-disulfide isomerase
MAMARSSLLALALVACAHSDPRIDDTSRRVGALEQQLALQQQKLDELTRAIAAVDKPKLDARLDALDAKLERLVQQLPPPRPHRREPDPAAVYAVPIDGDPVLGPANAKVTLVMCGEFACPYCRRAWSTIDDLRKKYGADLRVVYKSFVVHPTVAKYPARAACAANHQGKWRALADLLWTKAFDTHQFEPAHIDELAAAARLDMKRYRGDVDGACPAEVERDQAQLTKLGVGATPTFFINGRFMAGAMPIEDFSKLVDEELAKANAAIAGGERPETYYEHRVLGKGLTELAPEPPL